uniref:Formin FH3 domain-containing protein n=1 Tax=Anopheles coluzzii TaxID=1518534 RepID=A0A8W7P1I7_ANOCL
MSSGGTTNTPIGAPVAFCVACVPRAISRGVLRADRVNRHHPPGPKMDARIGLEYIIENNDYVNKLGLALDTNNVTVKKQIFELLSTLCAFSANGYKRAIETLEHYKSIKGERYRLHLVVSELDKATAIEYQIALLAFVNCVIISAGSLKDRIRMRNEFIAQTKTWQTNGPPRGEGLKIN